MKYIALGVPAITHLVISLYFFKIGGFIADLFGLLFFASFIISVISIFNDKLLNWIDKHTIKDILLFRTHKQNNFHKRGVLN